MEQKKSYRRCKSGKRMTIVTSLICVVGFMFVWSSYSLAASAKDSKKQEVAPVPPSAIQKPGKTAPSPTIAPSSEPIQKKDMSQSAPLLSNCVRVRLIVPPGQQEFPWEWTMGYGYVVDSRMRDITNYKAKLFSVISNAFVQQIWSQQFGSRSGELQWKIPQNTAAGYYRIYVGVGEENSATGFQSCYGMSPPFRIVARIAEPEVVPPVYWTQIQKPDEGERYPTSMNLSVRWAASHDCLSPDNRDVGFTRILLKGNRIIQSIGPFSYCGRAVSMTGRGRYAVLEDFFNLYGLENGTDYQVRIEMSVYDSTTGTRTVLATATSGQFEVYQHSPLPR